MNNRERFLRTMRFEKVDHPPFHLDSPWPDTMRRWYREGYPPGVELADFLGISPLKMRAVPIDYWLIPPLDQAAGYEDEDVIVRTNAYGARIRTFKKLSSQPYEVEFAVKTGADLLRLLDGFRTDAPGRIPSHWEDLKRQWRADDDAITYAFAGNYFDSLRNLMGLETLSLMLYDEPEAIRQYLDAYHRSVTWTLEQAFREVRIDYVMGGEDFACKTSSLISPAMYRELILPKHKAVAGFASQRGVNIFYLDSDGNLNDILPHLIEGGVNLIFPVECAAGMDPVQLRARFGKTLRMMGGIDKIAVAKGKEAIRRELFSKVPRLIDEGGYIPCIDHSVSSDISLENFVYYVEQLKAIYGVQ